MMLKQSLSSLTRENMGDWPLFVKVSVVVCVMLGVFALGYYVIERPLQHKTMVTQQQIVVLTQSLQRQQQKVAELPAYRLDVKKIQAHLQQLEKQLPAPESMPSVLEDIASMGLQVGLRFHLVKPLAKRRIGHLIVVPIKIEVVGQYQAIGQFLQALASQHDIIVAADFNLSAQHAVGEPERLVLQLQANTYRVAPKEVKP